MHEAAALRNGAILISVCRRLKSIETPLKAAG
jgi:hypothetical protein